MLCVQQAAHIIQFTSNMLYCCVSGWLAGKRAAVGTTMRFLRIHPHAIPLVFSQPYNFADFNVRTTRCMSVCVCVCLSVPRWMSLWYLLSKQQHSPLYAYSVQCVLWWIYIYICCVKKCVAHRFTFVCSTAYVIHISSVCFHLHNSAEWLCVGHAAFTKVDKKKKEKNMYSLWKYAVLWVNEERTNMYYNIAANPMWISNRKKEKVK